jgi:uncharacterized membrane protein YfcA
MGKLGERMGKFDDKAIYRANDPEQKIHWGRAALAYGLGSVFAGLLGVWLGKGVAAAVVLAVVIPGLIVYMIWRRNRNRRLTGSPTEWTEPE